MMPRRSSTENRWNRGFTVAFLAMAAAVMIIALAACSPKTAIIDVKDEKNNPKKMMITYDRNMENISATVDGKNIEVSKATQIPHRTGRTHEKNRGNPSRTGDRFRREHLRFDRRQ
jgi:hypothetical protein